MIDYSTTFHNLSSVTFLCASRISTGLVDIVVRQVCHCQWLIGGKLADWGSMTTMAKIEPIAIVGIGASAGGLKPIEEFFDHMPTESGLAFVIVQHLSPDFKSLMDELLARHTAMPIYKVTDGVAIQRDSIYLIPPEKNLTISNGKLLLTRSNRRRLHFPIDYFLESLAEQAGRSSIGVVLSGTGNDGSRGIKKIRQAGGHVLVQSPESAGFDGMPRSAVESGIVDVVCEPSEMPQRIMDYVGSFEELKNGRISNDPQEPEKTNTSSLDFVVGVGASAGGLRSIEGLLQGLEPFDNAAIVVVQHLSPDVVSLMDEILQRSSDADVQIIFDDQQIRAGVVYLAPPGFNVSIKNGRFCLYVQDRDRAIRPVDRFFESLAENFGDKAIGVVLSGSGVDGAKGIRAIRRNDGTTLVESFETAQFDSMPKSCYETKCVDGILKIPDLANWLNQQFRVPTVRPEMPRPEVINHLTGAALIFKSLSMKYQIDFSGYKQNTISRRIQRRQQIHRLNSIDDYADYVQQFPEELDALYQDLLIGVTKFFRDVEAFDLLVLCLQELIEKLPEDESCRIWCAGCASGEEAYSLAMLMYEACERSGRRINFKIFATDAHDGLLEVASRGSYDAEKMELVSRKRIEKFFELEDRNTYRVVPELRRHIVFAHHNVFNDPPFTRMHLVSCRNLLIYLNNEVQRRALDAFHFSLVVDGLLFLGPSESLGELAPEFRKVDIKWKIFQKLRHVPSRGHRLSVTSLGPDTARRRLVNTQVRDQPKSLPFTRMLDGYELALGHLVDSAILLDANRNIIHIFGDANRYLVSQTGRFSGGISDFLVEEARHAISAGLIRAAKQPNQPLRIKRVQFFDSDHDHSGRADVDVSALFDRSAQLQAWLISFVEHQQPTEERKVEEQVVLNQESSFADIRELESELIYTKDSLSATIEELETSNEELQATNEELVASNEELQSTNEELQSVNEELHTVNFENRRRIEELQELTDDLEVILENYEVGTLFLDRNLCIRKFTRETQRHFGLMQYDVGREITSFRTRLRFEDLETQLINVRDSGQSFNRIIEDSEGGSFLVEIDAYRSKDEIVGVIINIIDRTKRLALGTAAKYSLPNRGGYWHWPNVHDDPMWWAPACFDLLSLERESISPTFSEWKALVHPDDLRLLSDAGTAKCPFVRQGSIALRMKCGDDNYRKFGFYAVFEIEDKGMPLSMAGYIVPLDEDGMPSSAEEPV